MMVHLVSEMPLDKIKEKIIFSTPELLFEFALKFQLFDFSKIKKFIIDEAETLLAETSRFDKIVQLVK